MWETITQYLPTIITSGVTSTLVIFAIQTAFKSKIDNILNKQLETHKHELGRVVEHTKYDLQRKLQDFGLYNTKKHEAYLELHKLLLDSDGAVASLRGLQERLTFEEFDQDDIRRHLEERGVVAGKINDLLKLWERDKKSAVKEIHSYLDLLKRQDAKREVAIARNHLLYSRIYISVRVETLALDICKDLFNLLKNYDYPQLGLHQENQIIRDRITSSIEELVKQMRKELSLAYYEAPVE